MSRFEPIVRSWSAISRSLPQFAPARRPHARRRPMLECLESRSLLSTITLTVNSLADAPSSPGVTTLRGAITQADSHPSNSYVINFSVKGTINLTAELPHLTDNISIKGAGITLQRGPSTSEFSLLAVDTSGVANVSGIAFLGGTPGSGDIANYGTLTVNNSIFANNIGAVGQSGTSGIYNAGFLTVNRSVFSGNSGTAIDDNGFGWTVVNNSAFSENNVTGAAAITSGNPLTVNNSIFVDNTGGNGYGGAIDAEGGLTANGDIFIGNHGYIGGGIFTLPHTTATISNCIFVDNTAAEGGAIGNLGTVISTNNIFIGNTPDDIGS